MSDVQLAELIEQLPAVGMMALVIVGFVKGWIVTKVRFEEMREDRTFWRETALKALGVAEQAANRDSRADGG